MSDEENNQQETAPEVPTEPEVPQFPSDRIEITHIDIETPTFPQDRFEKGDVIDMINKIRQGLE